MDREQQSLTSWVEISPGPIVKNLQILKTHIPKSTDICVVLKADAFGHGLKNILPPLMTAGVSIIGITGNNEALTARELGFQGRILRIQPGLPHEVESGIDLNIEEWIGGSEHASMVAGVAATCRAIIDVHLSINSTGLSRDGISVGSPESLDAVRSIGLESTLRIVGICSHFPVDSPIDVTESAARFRVEADAVLNVLAGVTDVEKISRHCGASYAALSEAVTHMDMVRLGAAVFGELDHIDPRLRTGFSLKSRISAINEYPSGTTVGYDRTHVLTQSSRIAVAPIGYSGGIPRRFAGKAEVLVRGARAPIVGQVAMNSITVDVTGLDARIGDEVLLYGAGSGGTITHSELAAANGDVPAELFTTWGRLHPRVVVGTFGSVADITCNP